MDFKVNDKVMINPAYAGKWNGVVFTIEKFLTKNAQLVTCSGIKLRAKPHMLMAVKDDTIITADGSTPNSGSAQVFVKDIKWEPPLLPGTLIKFQDSFYVILAVNPSGRYRIVKLGSDGGKYYTNVNRNVFTVVDVSSLNLT